MLTELARLSFRAGTRIKSQLSHVRVLRRLYYGVVNADVFEHSFLHDLMLADRVRIDTYAAAIEKHIRADMVVCDLGTGSGVLACLAARRAKKVYAIEHTPMIERARLLAAQNGLRNIEFVRAHSADFHPSERIDVILHEQIGNALVDEDMVANIAELRDRVLAPGGIILPGRFELYIDPIEVRADAQLPFLWEQRFHGLDFAALRPAVLQTGTGYDKRAFDPDECEKRLTPPQRVLELDLLRDGQSSLPSKLAFSAVATETGHLDGFCLYFRVMFGDDISFSTGPGHRKTHWATRLLRSERTPVTAGDRIDFELTLGRVTSSDTWLWTHGLTHS